MLRLDELLADVRGAAVVKGDRAAAVNDVRDDSRQVGPGDLFVAVPGTKVDGTGFVADAVARGATVVVAETDVSLPDESRNITFVRVPDARRALAHLAATRHAAAHKLQLLAVTGTNGKTTTTYILESILAAAGHTAGVIGTVNVRCGTAFSRTASLTTPGSLALHRLFAEMRDAGASHVVMETSSHALHQRRLDGCTFRAAGLTNLTQDHLDYHGTMDAYFEAKAILFQELLADSGVGVVFVDREEGRRMAARIRGRVLGLSLQPGVAGADVVVRSSELTATGIRAELDTPDGPLAITTPLVGEFNLANLVMATGIALGAGIDRPAIAAGLETLRGVPGRLERVPNDRDVLCVVDYAHTPDALERAIAAMRPYARGRLLAVFGCGGDRDRGKRPLMGEVGARDADVAFVTSDNPRTEEPASIIAMILDGVRRTGARELGEEALASAERGFHVAADRRTAIRRAAAAARPGDVLLIAGKGHEDYQVLGTTKIHFDDREEAAAALANSVPGTAVR